jgi:hypothetical protein
LVVEIIVKPNAIITSSTYLFDGFHFASEIRVAFAKWQPKPYSIDAVDVISITNIDNGAFASLVLPYF